MTPIGAFFDLTTEVLKSVRTFFGPRVTERAQREANALALEQRQRQLELELRAERALGTARSYPLGTPGRLRPFVRDGVAPCLLVSPVAWGGASPETVASTVAYRVREVDPNGRFLQVLTGGFVRGDDGMRSIDGEIGAVEVAEFEFSPGPSLVVYFERAADALIANALLTNVLRTVDGDGALTMPLARLADGGLECAVWREPGAGARDVEWVRHPVDESGDGESKALAALASAVASFGVAITAVYWEMQGVRWRVPEKARTRSPVAGLLELEPSVERGGGRAERLEQELAGLIAAGLAPEVCDLNGDGLGIYVPLERGSAFFEIGPDYPRQPPEVLVRTADGCVERVALAVSHWEPAQSIVDLVKALP